MNCSEAGRLFGAYWDDETTQAERERLELHFESCATCRTEYEALARTLEVVGSLPRVDAAPDLAERALARARRITAAPERTVSPLVRWTSVAAVAAAVVVAAVFVTLRFVNVPNGSSPLVARSEPQRVTEPALPQAARPTQAPGSVAANQDPADVPDSLFDHAADLEFILDPVTLRRGRATVTHPPDAVQGEQAVITF